MDFLRAARLVKQPECIQDTSGLRVERQRRQKFKCEEYKLKNISYNRMRNNNRGAQDQQT